MRYFISLTLNTFCNWKIKKKIFQNFAEDKLREELRKLQDDKTQYQGAAKESIRKILQEKLEAVQKLQDLERYV